VQSAVDGTGGGAVPDENLETACPPPAPPAGPQRIFRQGIGRAWPVAGGWCTQRTYRGASGDVSVWIKPMVWRSRTPGV